MGYWMSLYNELPDKSFLKKLLIDVDANFVEKFLQNKTSYETASNKEDKRLYRDKMIGLFWELYGHIAQMINPKLSTAKRLFLRYGLTDLRYLTPDDQKFILNQKITTVNYDTETIFYADEWLQGVVLGKLKASSIDETDFKDKSLANTIQKMSAKQEKFVSLLKVETERITQFKQDRSHLLGELSVHLTLLKEEILDEDTGVQGVYDKEQNKALDDIINIQKELKKINKEINMSARSIAKAKNTIQEIKAEEGELEASTDEAMIVKEMINNEVRSLRQMAKMSTGRQGNAFPYLMSSIMPKETREYLFKDTYKKKLNHWLEYDPEAFIRIYRGQEMNILPYVILLPGYGTIGVCWEPLDPDNKQFGRGQLAFPIFTRSPDITLLSGIGDIRWQCAKEIASYYWMEEGLTGRYYEYYLGAKLKGDLRTLFISDYLLWMTKETQGTQKLEQDARYVFWRYVPLPDKKKENLSKKGYYYNQLWEKEQVWRQGQKSK